MYRGEEESLAERVAALEAALRRANSRFVSVGLTASGIPPAIIGARGDLIVGAGEDQPTRMPVGSAGYALVSDPAAANDLAWAPLPSTDDIEMLLWLGGPGGGP